MASVARPAPPRSPALERPLPPLPSAPSHNTAPVAPRGAAANPSHAEMSTSAVAAAPAVDLSALHARNEPRQQPTAMYPSLPPAVDRPAPPPRPLASTLGSSNAASMPEMPRRRTESPPRQALGGSDHAARTLAAPSQVSSQQPLTQRRASGPPSIGLSEASFSANSVGNASAFAGPGTGAAGNGGGAGQPRRDEPPVRELSEWTVRQQNGLYQAVVVAGNKDAPRREVLLGNYATEAEARQSCMAYAPPKWAEGPPSTTHCAVCHGSYGLITRRRHHCRNCGRNVCSACSDRTWPALMMPFTYNDKGERKARVCDTCHFLMEEFRANLLRGDEAACKAVYARGCINLRCPYTIYDNELPVHCAAKSGNISLLTWLLEDRRCPLYQDVAHKVPLVNRHRHSVLATAAAAGRLEVMRYLVWTQGADVHEITDLGPLWTALDKALRDGADVGGGSAGNSPRAHGGGHGGAAGASSGWAASVAGGGEIFAHAFSFEPNAPPLAPDADGAILVEAAANAASNGTGDECIVCFDRAVDSTLVPCGHHILCSACAAQIRECPACRAPVERAVKAIRI